MCVTDTLRGFGGVRVYEKDKGPLNHDCGFTLRLILYCLTWYYNLSGSLAWKCSRDGESPSKLDWD